MTSNDRGTQVAAGRAMRLLFGRQVLTLVINLAGAIALARILAPAEFGIYALITAAMSIGALAGDAGIGASLIQRRQVPSIHDLNLAFTLAVGLATLLWALVSLVGLAGQAILGFDAVIVLQLSVLASTLLLTGPRPSLNAQFERDLRYRPVAAAELLEVVVYQIAAVALAATGFGVWSFVLAAVARSGTGTGALLAWAPHRPRLTRRFSGAREMVRFGVVFQLGDVLRTVGNWAVPAVVAPTAGAAGMGYLTQAGANARRPLLLVDVVGRVSFPHFSRLGHDASALAQTIMRYVTSLQWAMLLWTALLLAVGGPLIELVYGEKWLPSVPIMQVLALTLPFEVVGWIFGFAYAATDRNWTELRIVAVRSLALLVLVPPAVLMLGVVGVAWATLVVMMVSSLASLRCFAAGLVRRQVRRLLPIVLIAAVSSAVGRASALAAESAGLVASLAVGSVACLALYLGASRLALGSEFRADITSMLRLDRHDPEPINKAEIPLPAASVATGSRDAGSAS